MFQTPRKSPVDLVGFFGLVVLPLLIWVAIVAVAGWAMG